MRTWDYAICERAGWNTVRICDSTKHKGDLVHPRSAAFISPNWLTTQYAFIRFQAIFSGLFRPVLHLLHRVSTHYENFDSRNVLDLSFKVFFIRTDARDIYLIFFISICAPRLVPRFEVYCDSLQINCTAARILSIRVAIYDRAAHRVYFPFLFIVFCCNRYFPLQRFVAWPLLGKCYGEAELPTIVLDLDSRPHFSGRRHTL